ncbi:Fe(3+)-hydroxamate ABC transporter permease FhuB [uncultured Castellaniella sp.]|uniref:Fe(3+)-hydroxamate ABC transporter permease FhuB n=1 Tax=uncultured Castellaniella sp. TaxID=647907 RepID=UPI00260B12B0|nr:Fe(3+)-hydroxamate ABC transporter permease FhuB [uncultured Castellaniella sp.]
MTATPRTAILICAGLAFLLAMLAAVSLQPLGGMSAALAALRAASPANAAVAELLLSQSWWPRLVLALLAGGGLALAGELLQLLLRNPLASAATLGISSGASVALMLATLFAPSLLAQGREWAAMLGAGLTLALVFRLSWRHGLDPLVLIVVGMTLNLLLGGLSIVLLLFNHEALSGLLIWGAGSLAQQGWDGVRFLAPRLLICVLCLLPLLRPLRLATLDDVTLHGLGLPVRHLRLIGLGIAVFLAGSLVSGVGVIGFVGLAAPNIMKLAGAPRLASRLPLSMLFGALLLACADQLVQAYASEVSAFVPTGAVTAALGVPLLLWLLTRLRLPTAPGAAGDARMPFQHGAARGMAWLGVLLLLALLLALSFGQLLHGWHWQAPFGSNSLQWRLPRVIAAGCGGVLLALSGTILQRLTGNPLASPELLGVSSGSAIALLLGVFLLRQPGYLALSGMALLGAGAALLLILASNRRNRYSPQGILLTGIALGALYEALRSLLLADGDPRGQQVTAWLSGSTYYASASMSWLLLALVAAALPLAAATSRWQDLFPLGQPTVHALGVPVHKARVAMLLIAAASSALATLVVGPLSFVGLIAPHMARALGFRRAREQLTAAALMGAIVMILADWMGRQILFPQEVPAGLMASLAGGSYFLWQIRRWR